MSADLLSQQSPPASGGDTSAPARDAAAPPRSSLRSDACVWNSSRKQPPLNTTNNNTADGRPSFQSNMGTCHSTNKRGATNDSLGAPTNHNSLQVELNNDKKMGEPWRNYDKSYARLSARNPVNYTANAAAANDDNNEDDATNNNNCNNDEAEGNATKRTPPSSKKKKTHKLMRRLQHHSTKLQHNSSSSSHSSSTRNNNDKPTPARPTYNNHPILLASPRNVHSPVGQEIEIVDNEEEEEYEEFSPLTCTLSQANFFRGGMDVDGNDEEEDDGSDEEEVEGNDDEEEEEEVTGREEGSGQLKNDEDYESKAASDPTVVKDYTAALKASTTNNNVNNQGKSNTEKRGTKRKPTALDLALIEESTKNAAAEANNNKNGSGRNKRRNKFKAVAAALAEKEDSQTPPYDVPTPRNAEEEGKNEEEESMGNDEVNFFPSNDDDDNEEETGTEKQSDALLSSPSAKQSEPLLSSPSIQPQGATVAAATSTVATAAAAAAGTSEITTDELVNNLRDICDNLGKALTCPICQASLREAQLLPCCHAFCKSCLATTFNPPRSKNKGKKKKGSPPPTAYKQCPTCKNPADRRSVVPIPQLDDQVRAYKQILVVFGITPYVYGEGIAMTQLDPEDNGGMVLDEEDRRQCLQASRTVNGVVAREYETVQAKAAAAAATIRKPPSKLLTHPLRRSRSSSSKPQQQQRLTKEQMESQNELRRWQQVAKEQENVVKVNEGALNKVKGGRAHQLVQRKMVQAETAKFLATVNEADESKPAAVNKTVDSSTAANGGDDSDNDDEAEFCTAPDSDSVEYDTAKESQGLSTTITTAAPSPMVINDGNTVKKAERSSEDRTTSMIPGSRVLDLEVSPEAQKKKEGRESFGTVGTGNASPIVLHDGNTVRKTRAGKKDEKSKSSESHEDKTPRSSGNFLRCEGVAMKSASNADMEEDDDEESDYGAETQPLIKSAPLKSGSQEDDESEYGAETQPIIGKPAAKPAPKQAAKPDAKPAAKPAPKHADENPVAASASIDEPAQTEQIVKGSVVMVQARTWPGINKHGGVGRVTQVHSSTTSGGSAVQYDVSYVLGGKEKSVDESFVHLHKTSEEESTTRVSSARKPRKSSEKKVESRRPKRTQQKVTFKEEVSIYNEEELKHIPAEALEWAGIVPKKGKGKKKAAGKKRALADSNSNTTPTPTGTSTKKQKAAPAAAASSKIESKPKKKAKSKKEKVEAEKESNAVEALMAMAHESGTSNLNDIINPLSNQEIVQYADERYSSLLSASGSSDVSLVLNMVTSNLSDEESDSLNSLCKLLKDKNGETSCFAVSNVCFLL
eukprot:scaffold4912_cov74-Skeletonema_dohrnii-CCMP3373.AAC.4